MLLHTYGKHKSAVLLNALDKLIMNSKAQRVKKLTIIIMSYNNDIIPTLLQIVMKLSCKQHKQFTQLDMSRLVHFISFQFHLLPVMGSIK